MLFNFDLTPLPEVQPWGADGNKSLHWFGLTDGHYWIDVGSQRLFEYSETARTEGSPPYCYYQVVRLYEDVLDIAPYVLESVPADLVARISGSDGKASAQRVNKWCGQNAERDDDDFWATLDAAQTWVSRRDLDSAYLSPGVDVIMWSDSELVHIEWDNSQKLYDGACAWTAVAGTFSLPRSEFAEQVRSFHCRLMAQMATRVGQVVDEDVLSPDIRIDRPALLREQSQRSELSRGVLEPVQPTDWDAVRRAFAVVDSAVR